MGHVNCDTCGQYQEMTSEWLTCVFCGEILMAHPYFRKPDGEAHGSGEEETESDIIRPTEQTGISHP